MVRFSNRYPVPPPSCWATTSESWTTPRNWARALALVRSLAGIHISPLGNSGIHQAHDSGIHPREQSGPLIGRGSDRQTPRSLYTPVLARTVRSKPEELSRSGLAAWPAEVKRHYFNIYTAAALRSRRRTSHTPAPASTRRLRLTGRFTQPWCVLHPRCST